MKGNVKKKLLIAGITIIFSLLLFSFTMQSDADDEVTVAGTWDVSADDGASNVTATLYSDGSFIVSGTGAMVDYSNSISRPYDDYVADIKTVQIQSGVTSIGRFTFYYCRSLTSIEIPSSVTSIGSRAFEYCRSLTSIEIPEGVTSIGDYAFYECSSLTSIEIPSGVTSIGSRAFDSCSSLTSIEIPSSVTSIGSYAFDACSSLTSIDVNESNQNYSSENGVLFNKDKTTIIKYPEGKNDTTYTILSSVMSIGSYAVCSCSSLTSIEIPSSVTSIGSHAFEYCSSLTSINVSESNQNYSSENGVLFNKDKTIIIKYPEGKNDTTYTIPSSVTRIGSNAFAYCSSLTSIEIPQGVTSIGDYAFYECSSLTSIEIPSSVTSIGYYAFEYCSSLTSIEIPSSVTSIGYYAFEYCSSLTSIEIPSGVTSIGSSTFEGCSSLTSIEIPSGVTSIGSSTFEGCSSLTSIEIPEGVTSIGNQAFKGCSSLTSIKIPSSVTSIGDRAFSFCSSLTSIEIPSSVTSIGDRAFNFCSSLTIYCKSDSYAKEYAETNNITYVIDDKAPNITSVTGNPTQWTKENVTLTVTASDAGSGLATQAYSFDGGQTWQAENTKTYTENTNGIVIKVRDALGNIATYNTISITKIDKIPPVISNVTGNPTQWTKENVTLTVTANDTRSGLATQAYSFDGGQTWQAENTKTYTENTDGIVIKVRDNAGNIATYGTINITKIEKVTSIIISKAPTKTVYLEGEDFDSTGMVVEANYNSQNTETITNYTIIDGNNLKAGQTSVTISYTENGETKTTVQAITVEEKLNITISGYETTQENGINYIKGIKPETTIQGVLNNIETNGTAKVYQGETRITDANTKSATGMTIKISLGTQEETYTLVVTGDLNGEGQLGNVDLLKLVRHNAGLDTNLSGAYLKAADIYKDGKYADNKDILKMARVLAGLETL